MRPNKLTRKQMETVLSMSERGKSHRWIACYYGLSDRTIARLLGSIREAGGLGAFLQGQQARLRDECAARDIRRRRGKGIGPGFRETWTSVLPGFDRRAFQEALIPKL